MARVSDDDLHDWVVLADEMYRRCRLCGRYQWWFMCLNVWRYDIPVGVFNSLGWKFPELNLAGKFTHVSKPMHDQYGACYKYVKANPQPEIPKHQGVARG